ncbi:gephyrin-like molybdotransferase Glp [Cupriavidus sp. 2TAF22]|uniref:molybdopterin molybdotransferase MoeA n=1 Tax=unclassified Cupriavidus TaxID=2640874 RepID=UPI003F914481
MLGFDKAQALFAQSVESVAEVEMAWLSLANGRILARDMQAQCDAPPADKSAMDGYAIRHADYGRRRPLPIQQVCYAGMVPQPLEAGHAIRLYTGSLIPAGADTVVPQEDAAPADGSVTFTRAPAPGQHIRRQAEDVRAGQPLLSAGTLLQPGHIAALASQGVGSVPVFRLAEVAILTTGDEVAANDEPHGAHQVWDVNGPMLEALVQSIGAVVRSRNHVPDDEAAVHEALLELAREADILLVTGGASTGAKDLVNAALVSAGGELLFQKVNMKPGKPISLGRLRGKPVVSLPGNPAAAYTTFALLVTPMLRKLQGRAELCPPVGFVHAQFAAEKTAGRDEFLRAARVAGLCGMDRARLSEQQGAASVSALGGASGFVRVSPQTEVRPHDLVPFYDLNRWLC